jgi:trans-aconitate methyltransferase
VVTPDLYTHGHHESVLRSHRWRTAENSAAYLLPHLHRWMSLLDVGCGPGTITFDLARRVAPGRVVGVDLSADVIEQAARAARAERAVDCGIATEAELADVAGSWREWAAEPGGVFVVVHGEVVARA